MTRPCLGEEKGRESRDEGALGPEALSVPRPAGTEAGLAACMEMSALLQLFRRRGEGAHQGPRGGTKRSRDENGGGARASWRHRLAAGFQTALMDLLAVSEAKAAWPRDGALFSWDGL